MFPSSFHCGGGTVGVIDIKNHCYKRDIHPKTQPQQQAIASSHTLKRQSHQLCTRNSVGVCVTSSSIHWCGRKHIPRGLGRSGHVWAQKPPRGWAGLKHGAQVVFCYASKRREKVFILFFIVAHGLIGYVSVRDKDVDGFLVSRWSWDSSSFLFLLYFNLVIKFYS